jgi:hypothetical protein
MVEKLQIILSQYTKLHLRHYQPGRPHSRRSQQCQSTQLAEYTFIYIISMYRLIYRIFGYSPNTKQFIQFNKFVHHELVKHASCHAEFLTLFSDPMCGYLPVYVCVCISRNLSTSWHRPCHRSSLLGAVHQHPTTVVLWLLISRHH